MAKLDDDRVKMLFQEHLHLGENVEHWAYGIRQPSFFLIFLLYVIAILPGAIALLLLTKHYLVALTNRRRLLILRTNSSFVVQGFMEYSLGPTLTAKASLGLLFTHIEIIDATRPFVVKFHRMGRGLSDNRQQSVRITEALTGQKLLK